MKLNYRALANIARYTLVAIIVIIAAILLIKPPQAEQGENYSSMCNGCRQIESCNKLGDLQTINSCEKVDDGKQKKSRQETQ